MLRQGNLDWTVKQGPGRQWVSGSLSIHDCNCPNFVSRWIREMWHSTWYMVPFYQQSL